jgi:hypothetical protein
MEDVLHAGKNVDRDVDTRLTGVVAQPPAVVEQRLIATDLDVDRR